MIRLFLHLVLNAVALIVVAHFVDGFTITNFGSALIAVVVIGLFNATLGLLLKIITLPLGILTFGLFFLVINAVILWFSSKFVPGFSVTTFKAALWRELEEEGALIRTLSCRTGRLRGGRPLRGGWAGLGTMIF